MYLYTHVMINVLKLFAVKLLSIHYIVNLELVTSERVQTHMILMM